MTIRERVRRALHTKLDTASDSSDNLSQTDSNPATPTTSNSSHSSSDFSQSLSAKLSRTFTWGSRDKDSSGKDKSKKKRKPIHPSERPFTSENMKHQQILNQYSLTFGTNNMSQLELEGISPCCTRAPSIDGLGINYGPSSSNIADDEIAPA